MADTQDHADDGFHSEDKELVAIWDRTLICAFELNLCLRAASMRGSPVPIDLVQRIDPITHNEYTEVLMNGLPDQSEDEGEYDDEEDGDEPF